MSITSKLLSICKPMRAITKKSVLSFTARRAMRSGDMSVSTSEEGCTSLRLHGNSIARMDARGIIAISNAGWNSRTTNDRLNGLLHYLPGQGRVHSKDFSPYLNGAPWDGSWTVVHDPALENARCLAVQVARLAARDVAIAEAMHKIIAYDAAQASMVQTVQVTLDGQNNSL